MIGGELSDGSRDGRRFVFDREQVEESRQTRLDAQLLNHSTMLARDVQPFATDSLLPLMHCS